MRIVKSKFIEYRTGVSFDDYCNFSDSQRFDYDSEHPSSTYRNRYLIYKQKIELEKEFNPDEDGTYATTNPTYTHLQADRYAKLSYKDNLYDQLEKLLSTLEILRSNEETQKAIINGSSQSGSTYDRLRARKAIKNNHKQQKEVQKKINGVRKELKNVEN